jgi:hypothetical protein
MLPNVAEFPVLYYGILRAGAVVVPMNPLLNAREIEYYLGDSGASLIFAWHGVADEAAKGAEAAGTGFVAVEPAAFAELLDGSLPVPAVTGGRDDATAVVLYTSGTTGRPKGAELTHANLARNAAVTATTLLRLEPDDVPRRLQRLPAGGRGGPLRAPGRRRGRRDRHPAPDPRRGGRRRGGAQARCRGHPGGAAGLLQGADRGLQIPEVRVAGAGVAEDGNREAAPPRGAAARRPVAVTTPTRAPADRRFTGPAWTSNVMDR